jgi:hypothetical protein
MSKAPEMPQGTLLQSVLVNAEGETSGYRIYTDGRYETKVVTEGWKSAEPLSPAQVKRAVEAVSETEFEQLQPHYQPARPATDSNTLWMQADKAGKRFDIEIVGSCEVPAIQTLSARIVDIFREGKP